MRPDALVAGLGAGLLGAGVALLGEVRAVALLPEVAARAGERYDRSPGGRRLESRLRSAALQVTPHAWRRTQLAVAAPSLVLVHGWTGSWLAAVSAAVTATRLGGRAVLRVRAGTRDARLEEAAARIARRLAGEMPSGASPRDVLSALAGPPGLWRTHFITVEVVRAIDGASRRGAPVAAALATVAAAEAPGRGRRALERVAAILELTMLGGADVGGLARCAAAIEGRRRLDAQVRAVLAEPRMSATAIPVVSVVIGAAMTLAQPGGVTAVIAAPLFPLAVGAAAVGVGGTALVRRLTDV